MNIVSKVLLVVSLSLLCLVSSFAQENKITEAYKTESIETLCHLMNDFYVFPEVAKSTEKHLMKLMNDGYFEQFDNNSSFADALTESVQFINNDKHMRIRVNRPYVAQVNTPERKIEERLDIRNRSRNANYGFNKVEILEGNIGYLDLRGFAGLNNAKGTADAAMKLLSRTDAVIFDLRKNGGGSPEMVQYLCSFFFDEVVHLNSLYYREGDVTYEYWTLDSVGGLKMPDVPLFVLTSNRTFSGAEEFSYNMQTRNRAVLIGQTTGGGANPGGTRGINENLSVFIPTGRAINPVTKTNWEGIGVIPEIDISEEETMSKALELAGIAAHDYRESVKEEFNNLYSEVLATFELSKSKESEDKTLMALKSCIDADFLTESDINSMGYEYLLEHKKEDIAGSIFKCNTILFPNSANVFDSYAESLMMKGDLKSSLEFYKKAVEIAINTDDRDVDLFKDNLNRVKKMIENRP